MICCQVSKSAGGLRVDFFLPSPSFPDGNNLQKFADTGRGPDRKPMNFGLAERPNETS